MGYNRTFQTCRPTQIGGLANYAAGGSRNLTDSLVYGTSGNCVGWKFCSPTTTTLTDVYIYITAAPAVSRSLRCYLCNYNTYQQSGTSITYVESAGGTTANKWIRFQFSTSNSVNAGEVYWLVVGDPAYDTSAYSIKTANAGPRFGLTYLVDGFYSTAGFSAAGTGFVPGPLIIKMADGTLMGQLATDTEANTSGTIERGILIGPMQTDMVVEGMTCYNSYWVLDTDIVYIRCYEHEPGALTTPAPGGSIYSGFNGGTQYTITTSARSAQFHLWFPATRLRMGRYYRITLAGTGGSWVPPYYNLVGDSSTISDYIACPELIGGGVLYYYTADNSGAWRNYNNTSDGVRLVQMGLLCATYANERTHTYSASLKGSEGI